MLFNQVYKFIEQPVVILIMIFMVLALMVAYVL